VTGDEWTAAIIFSFHTQLRKSKAGDEGKNNFTVVVSFLPILNPTSALAQATPTCLQPEAWYRILITTTTSQSNDQLR
jgi:hypothetical protein